MNCASEMDACHRHREHVKLVTERAQKNEAKVKVCHSVLPDTIRKDLNEAGVL